MTGAATSRASALALVLLGALASPLARGDTPGQAGGEPRRVFVVRPLIAFDVEYERNFDLDRRTRDDVREVEPMLRLTATYTPHDWFRAFIEIETPVTIEHDQDRGSATEAAFNLNQAYVEIKPIKDLSIRLGRQLVRDDREWLFDENLDGLRVLYRSGDLSLDASVSRVNIVRRDLRDRATVGNPIDNHALLVDYRLLDTVTVGAYAVSRSGRRGEEGTPLLLGLRARGRLFGDRLDYWLDAATVRGRDEQGRRLAGHGFDLGATYAAEAPLRPRLTLGYAWGSGDGRPGDGTNRAFRQTGLQSNEARFGGRAKFKYYGEVLDPELSNLHIVTAGLGFSPSEAVSIDLVYHRYRQDRVADRLRDAAIDLRPNRNRAMQSRDLGQAIDLVVGVALTRSVEIEFAVGYFMPGRAYQVRGSDGFRRADEALFARLEIEFAF